VEVDDEAPGVALVHAHARAEPAVQVLRQKRAVCTRPQEGDERG